MLKEAIEKIQELCAPHLFTSGNHDFIADADGSYTEVKPDLEIVDNKLVYIPAHDEFYCLDCIDSMTEFNEEAEVEE